MKNIEKELCDDEFSRVITITQHKSSGTTIEIKTFNEQGTISQELSLDRNGNINCAYCNIETIGLAKELKEQFELTKI